jgi:hypothetical protein
VNTIATNTNTHTTVSAIQGQHPPEDPMWTRFYQQFVQFKQQEGTVDIRRTSAKKYSQLRDLKNWVQEMRDELIKEKACHAVLPN